MDKLQAIRGIAFDLDGTLIESYMDRPDKAFAPVVLLPGVAERWAYLRSETGNNLAIITNQAGVAYGYNSKDDVRRKLCVVGAALGYGWIKLHEGDEPLTLHDRIDQLRIAGGQFESADVEIPLLGDTRHTAVLAGQRRRLDREILDEYRRPQ